MRNQWSPPLAALEASSCRGNRLEVNETGHLHILLPGSKVDTIQRIALENQSDTLFLGAWPGEQFPQARALYGRPERIRGLLDAHRDHKITITPSVRRLLARAR